MIYILYYFILFYISLTRVLIHLNMKWTNSRLIDYTPDVKSNYLICFDGRRLIICGNK